MLFDKEIIKILEDFNIYPKSKVIQGRQAPVPSKSINFQGVVPVGFKGSGSSGTSPSSNSTVVIKWPKKKRKRKIKKK
jgi:hypothetical protein